MNQPKRLLELDVLRGIAAFGVVLYHYAVSFQDKYDQPSEIFKFLQFFQYGKHGVELFFLISGFVIFMSLERAHNSSDFIFGRFVRIYPAYWTAVIFSSIVATIAATSGFPDMQIDSKDALINLTMLQRFFNVPSIDVIYWTLELELSFYLAMACLRKARLLKKIDSIAMGWLLIAFINFILQQQGIFLFNKEIGLSFLILLLIYYAHLFIIGILIYKIYREDFSVQRYALILLSLVLNQAYLGSVSTFFVMLFIAVFGLILRGYLTFINQKPLIFLGTISYSLYLIHSSIGLVFIRTLEKSGANLNFNILVALLLSILLATAITFFIEKPAINFIKNKYKILVFRTQNRRI